MYGTTPLPLKSRRLSEATEKFWYYPRPTESRGLLEMTENFCYYPPPTESRRLPETTENFGYYPPPTESRRLGTSTHERGPLLRKILDLRLSRQVFGFSFDPEYSEEEIVRMDAHRCIEEADLCDFNNALIRGYGMLLQGSKFVVAMVANATMFSHLLPGCSCGSKHVLLP